MFLTYAMFWKESKHLVSLHFLLLSSIACASGECNGRRKSERITVMDSKYTYVTSGDSATIHWIRCIAVNSSATGIVIYRESTANLNQEIPIVSMDLSKNVYHWHDRFRHQLDSFMNKTIFQEVIIFVIKNTSEADSGGYVLQLRRRGEKNLYSKVQLMVNVTGSTKEPFVMTSTRKGVKTVLNNSTDLTVSERKAENVLHSTTIILVPVIVSCFVILIVIAILVMRRIKRKHALCFKMNYGEDNQPVVMSNSFGVNSNSIQDDQSKLL